MQAGDQGMAFIYEPSGRSATFWSRFARVRSPAANMPSVSDLNPIERRLIDWLSRQSDMFLVSLPIAVFLVLALFGVLLISAFAGQSLFNNPAIVWLSVATGVAALGLYLTTIEVMGVAFIRSRRFKLLELHQTMRDIQAMSISGCSRGCLN